MRRLTKEYDFEYAGGFADISEDADRTTYIIATQISPTYEGISLDDYNKISEFTFLHEYREVLHIEIQALENHETKLIDWAWFDRNFVAWYESPLSTKAPSKI